MPENDEARDPIEIKFEGVDRTLSNHDRRLAAAEQLAERLERLERQPVPVPVDEISPSPRKFALAGVLIGVAMLLMASTRGPSIRA